MGTNDEIVKYGMLERRVVEVGLNAKIPYEELRDWYCEFLLGEIQMGEFLRRIELRVEDPDVKRILAGLKASVPNVVENG